MLHRKIKIQHENETGALITYILDNYPEIDANRKRPMVIICPGGGFGKITNKDAEPVAIRLNTLGFHACVLKYSIKPAVFPTQLCQLAKAVGIIRDHADEWNVAADKIIVMGFSAGGHLAACLGVFWNKGVLAEKVAYSKEQIKPNGMVLGYPVITSGEYSHRGSFQTLLGDRHQEEELLDLLSLEKQVTKDTPPTFLWHTYTDAVVPVENSFLFAKALRENHVSLEMHIYPRGPHALSLGTEETMNKENESTLQPAVANWIEMAGRWIKEI